MPISPSQTFSPIASPIVLGGVAVELAEEMPSRTLAGERRGRRCGRSTALALSVLTETIGIEAPWPAGST